MRKRGAWNGLLTTHYLLPTTYYLLLSTDYLLLEKERKRDREKERKREREKERKRERETVRKRGAQNGLFTNPTFYFPPGSPKTVSGGHFL